MGFPPPSAEEQEEYRRKTTELEAKIEALKQEICHKKEATIRPIPLAAVLPHRVQAWLQRLLIPHDVAESIDSAQVEHDWLIYDRTSRRRPLYPRKRALSLADTTLMTCHSQRQSPFFCRLPAEIRRLVYAEVLGGLTIEIQVTQGGSNGPKGSERLSVFRGSRIDDSAGRYWCSPGYKGYSHKIEGGFRPWILPLLQTCRRVYTEAINVLYISNTFKSTQHHSTIHFPKYPLKHRLHSIRSFHCILQLGYPWHVQRLPLLALVELRGLQRLHIEGVADGMIDSRHQSMIDADFWREKKHYLIPFIRKLNFVKDVDLYLPILASDLGKDVRVGHCRVHGIVTLPVT